MATKKDMRRAELSTHDPFDLHALHLQNKQLTIHTVVPYTEGPQDKENNDFQGTISSTLPMAAVSLPHSLPPLPAGFSESKQLTRNLLFTDLHPQQDDRLDGRHLRHPGLARRDARASRRRHHA